MFVTVLVTFAMFTLFSFPDHDFCHSHFLSIFHPFLPPLACNFATVAASVEVIVVWIPFVIAV
jgi:hypothetical protein